VRARGLGVVPRPAVPLLAITLLVSCAISPDPGVDSVPDSGGDADTAADTGGQPDPLADWQCTADDTVTWGGFADGFFSAYCRSCHSTTTPDRRGAPEGVDFTDRAEVLAWAPRIKARVLDDDTMPPGGGTVDEDRIRFEGWLCAQTGGR
jgi:hypothetical protein